MIESKRRAWVHSEKPSKMYEVAGISWMEEQMDVYDGHRELGHYHSVSLYDANVMDYTHRVDVNGKEIYVDDIIRIPDGDFASVSLEYGAYGYQTSRGFAFLAYTTCEIVGNIYENPELRKEVI